MNVIYQFLNYCTNNLIDIYTKRESIGSEIFKGLRKLASKTVLIDKKENNCFFEYLLKILEANKVKS